MSKSDDSLFSRHEHALEKAYEVCPDCGAELTIKHGKSGSFLGCANYPHCDYTRPVVEHERVDDQILAGTECPECGNELAVKQGRYGMFIGCTNYPQCHHIEEQNPKESANVDCPSCKKGTLLEKLNRQGKTFYSCDQYPKCKFVINNKPVAGNCEHCGFALLMQRKLASGKKLQCANKRCGKYQE